MQVLFFIFSKFFPSPARESSPGISRGCSLPVTQERAQAMVRVLAAAAAVVAAVAAAIIPATTVVAAATAAATPAVIPTAAVRTTAAAEDDDQDQNDPQAAVTTPTVVTTHRQSCQRWRPSCDLSPSYAAGAWMCAQVGSVFLFSHLASSGGFPPRMVSVGLQHRSSMSDMVAAGSFSAPPHWAQNSSTEL